jgi:hypothetical protein
MTLDWTIFAIPVFIASMLVERSLLEGDPERKGYSRRDTRASLTMGIVNVLINLVMKGVQLGVLTWIAGFAPWHLDPSSPATWCSASSRSTSRTTGSTACRTMCASCGPRT